MSQTEAKDLNNSLLNFLNAAQKIADNLQSQINELPKTMTKEEAAKYEKHLKELKKAGFEKVNKDLALQLKDLNKMLNFNKNLRAK